MTKDRRIAYDPEENPVVKRIEALSKGRAQLAKVKQPTTKPRATQASKPKTVKPAKPGKAGKPVKAPAVPKATPQRSAPPSSSASDPRWAAAYLALPKARAARANRVVDAQSFADAAFDLPCALQVGWKVSLEGVVEELEGRFAPAHYVDHERAGKALVVWLEDSQGRRARTVRLEPTAEVAQAVASVSELVEQTALPLGPLNDGDDLHFLLLEHPPAQRLRTVLGPTLLRSLVTNASIS